MQREPLPRTAQQPPRLSAHTPKQAGEGFVAARAWALRVAVSTALEPRVLPHPRPTLPVTATTPSPSLGSSAESNTRLFAFLQLLGLDFTGGGV